MPGAQRIRESDLFEPVRDFLIERGYDVHAEVRDCDITATRGDELVVVELKRSFNASLLIQASERQRTADSVYVAIPAPDDPQRGMRWRGMCRLLRRLELGLLLVYLRKGGPRVQVQFHPGPYAPRRNRRLRRAVIAEIAGRSGNHNVGGSPAGTKLVTAYRETALFIACCLERFGSMRPADLRKLGTGPKTQSILYSNHYGWFDRLGDGEYALRAAGREAIEQFSEISSHYREVIEHGSTTE